MPEITYMLQFAHRDSSDIPEILGSIAGDDTIFIVIREGYSREAVIQALNEVIK